VGGEDFGSVVVLDTRGNRKVQSRLAWSLEGLAWSPSGDEVWYAASEEQGWANEIHALRLSGADRVVLRLPGMLRFHDISPDGRVLFSKEASRGSLVFRGPLDSKDRDLSWFDYPVLNDISADGASIASVEAGEAAPLAYLVYIRNTSGLPAVKLGHGERAAFSPDGKWVLAVQGTVSDRLSLLPIGTGQPVELQPTESNILVPRAGCRTESRLFLLVMMARVGESIRRT
jgi:eukaryotic-like serine/threonine-protein kinase